MIKRSNMLKKSSILVLLFLFIIGAGNLGIAEMLSEQETILIQAADAAGDWLEIIAENIDKTADEDGAVFYQLCKNALMFCQVGLLEDTEPEKVLETRIGEAIPRNRSVARNQESFACNTSMVWQEDTAVYMTVDAYVRNGFGRFECSLYSKSGEYLASECIEIGERYNQLMVLVIDYDHVNRLTGRFAIHVRSDEQEVIFTKTFGKNMKIKLDVEEWQLGKEIEKWDKSLLLPAV